ncbi:hypothetical protein [Kibdelosporangium aridum]|nr:hypothetical protein [Kibdelosporangium aridum]
MPERVGVEYSAESLFRCRACGEDLISTTEGLSTVSGEVDCRDFEPPDGPDSDQLDGPHDPERVPLSWCNSAAVHSDESQDSVTVSISVGDPRGAFTFTIRRVPDDSDGDLAGQLVMHTPYVGEAAPHMPLAALHDGTYLIGSPYATRA